jgi:GTP-binding protein Era
VDSVVEDCDVALLLVDPDGLEPGHSRIAERLARAGKPAFAVATKCDLRVAGRVPWPPELPGLRGAFRTSGRTGEGVEGLLDAVIAELPESPPYYADDEVTDRPTRFLVAELVREAAFEALSQEVPYQLAVEVRSYDESRPDLIRIHADLLVERSSQKGIVLGKGGAKIKEIGIQARRGIEAFLGVQVHLELWVKHEPGWAKKPKRLKSLGYS